MKILSTILFGVTIAACQQPTSNELQLQARIDSLQQQLNNAYKPGLGEFMSSIQVHHARLWFSGINGNWPLAEFEMKEISEALDDIRQYNSDRPETKHIHLLLPALDSVENAISNKNIVSFKSSFTLLTNACNNCHKETEHSFNQITIPTSPPFSNQSFKAFAPAN